MKIATHPVPVSSPPAWISSLHDGWRTRKQNTNCKNVADGPPSHASLCTGLLSCRSVDAVHPFPSANCQSRWCRSTTIASGSFTLERSSAAKAIGKYSRRFQTRTGTRSRVSERVGFRYGPQPVASSVSSG